MLLHGILGTAPAREARLMGEFTHAEVDDALCQAFARVAEAGPEG